MITTLVVLVIFRTLVAPARFSLWEHDCVDGHKGQSERVNVVENERKKTESERESDSERERKVVEEEEEEEEEEEGFLHQELFHCHYSAVVMMYMCVVTMLMYASV